jgi:hypothetical protein
VADFKLFHGAFFSRFACTVVAAAFAPIPVCFFDVMLV